MARKVQFKFTLKSGSKLITEVKGLEMDPNNVRIGDILDLEQNIEKVTGFRCHVEQINN